jgi:hypothetical protein
MDKKVVDSISSSFCAAKWTQVTIDLQHGMNQRKYLCPTQHEV